MHRVASENGARREYMKTKMIIGIIIFVIVIGGLLSYFYQRQIDTLYAVRYGEVFGSYDIQEVDRYLNSETLITYKGETKTYSELRENVILAFSKREYEMPEDSSYGHGNDKFINGIQEVGINSYIISDKHYSNGLQMEIERIGFFFFKVKSIQSEDEFFGYLFFGITE